MKKKVSKTTLRNKADTLLQLYIKAKYKSCLVCGAPVSCGHHFFSKANSNALRYYLPNIIPICQKCHYKVHSQPHLVTPIICYELGKAWYDDLMTTKIAIKVKANREWYEMNITALEGLLKVYE